jgi:hypothetical protein
MLAGSRCCCRSALAREEHQTQRGAAARNCHDLRFVTPAYPPKQTLRAQPSCEDHSKNKLQEVAPKSKDRRSSLCADKLGLVLHYLFYLPTQLVAELVTAHIEQTQSQIFRSWLWLLQG